MQNLSRFVFLWVALSYALPEVSKACRLFPGPTSSHDTSYLSERYFDSRQILAREIVQIARIYAGHARTSEAFTTFEKIVLGLVNPEETFPPSPENSDGRIPPSFAIALKDRLSSWGAPSENIARLMNALKRLYQTRAALTFQELRELIDRIETNLRIGDLDSHTTSYARILTGLARGSFFDIIAHGVRFIGHVAAQSKVGLLGNNHLEITEINNITYVPDAILTIAVERLTQFAINSGAFDSISFGGVENIGIRAQLGLANFKTFRSLRDTPENEGLALASGDRPEDGENDLFRELFSGTMWSESEDPRREDDQDPHGHDETRIPLDAEGNLTSFRFEDPNRDNHSFALPIQRQRARRPD